MIFSVCFVLSEILSFFVFWVEFQRYWCGCCCSGINVHGCCCCCGDGGGGGGCSGVNVYLVDSAELSISQMTMDLLPFT